MRELVFATNNQHKTVEVRQLLEGQYKILNLGDIGCITDIPETGHTFAENAALKTSYVHLNYQMDCFADDSGLEVEALNNQPGIYSARYAGTGGDMANLQLVLKNMEGQANRKACFRTVVSLVQNNENYLFEGVINGTLREESAGVKGFGYDPIFQPDGYAITFAEMSMQEKNEISHRAQAMNKLIAFLKSLQV
ncbi:RdgB/HAM1 family non-canonical purine NTP pyrophosphatase [Pedobacter sp. CG_S7]|uniref:RdgB/HAM1 family non-canonical purine NTP pyrophosphatase n=1 Tax=Pedobacter sp. CG_S7 TaxID=3143930 RepID=UPI003398BD00